MDYKFHDWASGYTKAPNNNLVNYVIDLHDNLEAFKWFSEHTEELEKICKYLQTEEELLGKIKKLEEIVKSQNDTIDGLKKIIEELQLSTGGINISNDGVCYDKQ